MLTVGGFLLALGAAARITRFVTTDTLAAPLRAAVIRRCGPNSRAADFIECPWCVSLWVASCTTAAAVTVGGTLWFTAPAAALTASHLYSLAAQHLDV